MRVRVHGRAWLSGRQTPSCEFRFTLCEMLSDDVQPRVGACGKREHDLEVGGTHHEIACCEVGERSRHYGELAGRSG